MKKTTLAIAVSALFASHSAIAFDIYDKDGINIDFNGDIDLKIINSANKNGSDSDLEIETNFDDFDFDFEWKIDDSLSFIAATDWTVESDQKNDVVNDQSWVGAQYNNFMIRAGYQEDAIDPLGIDSFEILSIGRASGEQDGSGTKFAESIVAGYDFGSFELLASYAKASEEDNTTTVLDDAELDSSTETGTDSNGDTYTYTEYELDADTTSLKDDDYEGEVVDRLALYAKMKTGDFQFEAGIGQETDIDEETTVSFWQVQAEYSVGSAKLGVLYSAMNVDTEKSKEVDSDSTGLEINATYEVNDKLDVYAGYEILGNDLAGEDDYTGMGIGASYAFSKKVKLYVEAGTEDGTYVTGKSTNPGHSDKDNRTVGMLLSVDF